MPGCAFIVLRHVSCNVDRLQNDIIDPRAITCGTVVLYGALCGSCFCDPNISLLLVTCFRL